MSAQDPFNAATGNHQRIPFGIALTASFFLAAGGVADSFIVGPSPRER
jgi:hypothetical protein